MKTLIRPLTVDDVPAAHALITSSFPAELHPYLTMTQHGSQQFLHTMVEFSEWQPNRSYLLAVADGRPVGYAEFRTLDEGNSLLAYICVAERARGLGVATRLITYYASVHPTMTWLRLDVFVDNEPALALYHKLGFNEGTQTTWWTRPIPRHAAALSPTRLSITLDTPPFPLASLERYGFCEFQVNKAERAVRVGRMGKSVLRVFCGTDFCDDELLSQIAVAMPDVATAIVIVPTEEPVTVGSARRITTSLNMSIHARSLVT